MKALVQRVAEASVTVDGEIVARIGAGMLVLLGVRQGDTLEDVDRLARKLPALRIFRDDQGQMNRSVADTGGGMIVVSQFTLYADTRQGNRPGFSAAAPPDIARPLYEALVERLRAQLGAARVGTGIFGATMQVRLVNDGPVTVEIRTDTPHDGV